MADRLRECGVHCIAIKSSSKTPPVFRKYSELKGFVAVYENDCNLAGTLADKYGGELTHIIAGCEAGVELADNLSEILGLPTNGTALSHARRNKHHMAAVLRDGGVKTADTIQSNDVHELIHWAECRKSWPVVVKPTSSVASDNVHLCRRKEDIVSAFTEIAGQKNQLGFVNAGALAQEYLNGKEYVVDTVSLNGIHKVTGIWAYDRSGNRSLEVGYDTMLLIPYEGTLQDALSEYVFNVLDAIGVRFGPGHCEIIWRNEEPVLVEIGARLSAGQNAILSGVCGGISQLEETIKAMMAPDQFLCPGNERPRLEQFAANVFFSRTSQGRVTRIRYQDEITKLKTLYRFSLGVRPGDMLPRVPGMITLVHKDLNAITRDISQIRVWESSGLFEIESADER